MDKGSIKMLKTKTVYVCPNGHFEDTKERATAWHLHELLQDREGKETASFTACLEMIAKRTHVIDLLRQIDVPDSEPTYAMKK